jgi:hypothetical protein
MENLGIFYDHLVYVFYGHWKYFMALWYISPRFGMLYQEKSGNPGKYPDLYLCIGQPRAPVVFFTEYVMYFYSSQKRCFVFQFERKKDGFLLRQKRFTCLP